MQLGSPFDDLATKCAVWRAAKMNRFSSTCVCSVCLEQTNKYILCSSFPQSGIEVCILYTYHSIYRCPIKTGSKLFFRGTLCSYVYPRRLNDPMIIIISRKLMALIQACNFLYQYQCFLIVPNMGGDLTLYNIMSGPVWCGSAICLMWLTMWAHRAPCQCPH